MTPKQRAWAEVVHKSLDNQRSAFEAVWLKAIRRQFTREHEYVMSAYTATGKRGAIGSVRERQWFDLLLSLWKAAADKFGASLADEIKGVSTKASSPWWSSSYQKKVKRMIADKANQIVNTTKTKISRLIDAGAEAVADGLQALYDKFAETRAWIIAQTEAAAAIGAARQAAAEIADKIVSKTWITKADSRVRHSHAGLHTVTIPIDDVFSNGLAYPGDPNGAAHEVINCRCVLIYGRG